MRQSEKHFFRDASPTEIPAKPPLTAGFTLIELSIVLVIIGLIVGGVLVGRDLIRAASLKSVITDVSRYVTAVNTFRTKYNNELPGDMPDATTLWGQATWCGSGTSSSATATCNGDGNGQISVGGEDALAWQHLANAGLIAGQYSGYGAASPNPVYMPGVNVPQSGAFSNAGFLLFYYSSVTWMGGGEHFTMNGIPHVLLFGAPNPGHAFNWEDEAAYPVLSTQDAYNIDAKIDDGKPGTGNVFSVPQGSFFGTGNSSVCSIGGDTPTATYNLTQSGPQCALYFVTGF